MENAAQKEGEHAGDVRDIFLNFGRHIGEHEE